MCMCVRMLLHVWGEGACVGMYVSVHMEAQVNTRNHAGLFYPISHWSRVSRSSPELARIAGLACQLALGIPVSAFRGQSWRWATTPTQNWCGSWGSELVEQCFNHLVISPAPCFAHSYKLKIHFLNSTRKNAELCVMPFLFQHPGLEARLLLWVHIHIVSSRPELQSATLFQKPKRSNILTFFIRIVHNIQVD